jgi:hypothetical protein
MTKAIVRITAVLFGVVAGFATIPAATASADICDDGWKLYNAYSEMGDNATTWAMLENLGAHGCLPGDG